LCPKDKNIKIELNNKYCIEKNFFLIFKVMNAQFARLNFFI